MGAAAGVEHVQWLLSAGGGLLTNTFAGAARKQDVWDAWAELQTKVLPGVRLQAGYLYQSDAPRTITESAPGESHELTGGLVLQPAPAILAGVEAFHDLAASRGTYFDFAASHQIAIAETHNVLFSWYTQATTGTSWRGTAAQRRFERSGITHGALTIGMNVRHPERGGTVAFTCQMRGDIVAYRGCWLHVYANYRIRGGER